MQISRIQMPHIQRRLHLEVTTVRMTSTVMALKAKDIQIWLIAMVDGTVLPIAQMAGTPEVTTPVCLIQPFQIAVTRTISRTHAPPVVGAILFVHFHECRRCNNVDNGSCYKQQSHSANASDAFDLLNIFDENVDLVDVGDGNRKSH